MLQVITNEAGDWITLIDKSIGATLFEGHSISARDLSIILDDIHHAGCELKENLDELDEESMKIRGHILTGKYRHWCNEFDGLPVDEKCSEFKFCLCFEDSQEIQDLKDRIPV